MPTTMRLQVLIYPPQGLPSRPAPYSFLEITKPTITLDELASSIESRHSRLYPHLPQLIIHKLQDADSNDLDLSYTVGDVFSDKSTDKNSSVVRVIQSSPDRESSIPPESGLRPQYRKETSSRKRIPPVLDRGFSSALRSSIVSEAELGDSDIDLEDTSRRKRLKV
ncbi:Cdc14 phosphatase binding protein N-terminus-domain-containing protein [Kalaharituber pfeilii]|nr:Cdc14 phosphatase binding protein N-terminus-domain-containing protein [Kalaharituber pfeilii]